MLNSQVHYAAGNTFITELGCTDRDLCPFTELQNELRLILQEVQVIVGLTDTTWLTALDQLSMRVHVCCNCN